MKALLASLLGLAFAQAACVSARNQPLAPDHGGSGSGGAGGSSGGGGGAGDSAQPPGGIGGGRGGGPGGDAPVAAVDTASSTIAVACIPDRAICHGQNQIETCLPDGMHALVTSCAGDRPYCVAGACVPCFAAEHCPSPGMCRKAACNLATNSCVVSPAPGLSCEVTGSCSALGVCRKPVSLGAFSVDATEVTRGQYAEFLRARAGDVSGQPAYCSWNTTHVPVNQWPPVGDEVALPVNYVDWCDAQAYCRWAGKRLCGRIGGGSVPHDNKSYIDATIDQWFAACSGGGTKRFPYGNTYDATRCVGEHAPGGGLSGKPSPVGSFPGCEGGYPGLFDMSGNIVEWEDECVAYTGRTDLCRERGNSYQGDDGLPGNPGAYAGCDENNSNTRDSAGATRGFRCCVD
jgi:hypothetical protein